MGALLTGRREFDAELHLNKLKMKQEPEAFPGTESFGDSTVFRCFGYYLSVCGLSDCLLVIFSLINRNDTWSGAHSRDIRNYSKGAFGSFILEELKSI
jgi:hypothetical protein